MRIHFPALAATACGLALITVVPGHSQQRHFMPANSVVRSVRKAVSPSMRSLPKAIGKVSPEREAPKHRKSANQTSSQVAPPLDNALQPTAASPLTAIGELNFEGMDFDGVYPPDTNLAVGNGQVVDGQVVEVANSEYAVYNKATGALDAGPIYISSLFSALGGACAANGSGTDPVVLYDQIANRWVVTQTAYPPTRSSSNAMCIAISQTPDATGAYNTYEFGFGTSFPDYPKLASWADGYYYSADLFYRNSSTYLGAMVCSFNRDDLTAGASSPRFSCFQGSSSDYRLLPSDLDGSAVPPAGEPDFFLELGADNASLLLYRYYANWGGTAQLTGPTTIPVDSFAFACGGGQCIPQQGTNELLDSLGDGLMYRLAYRNFGDHESLVVSQSVNTGLSSGNVGVRWYEIQNPNGASPSVSQQSTYNGDNPSTDANYRWMGGIAQDQVGDMALGYSKSSSSISPGISFTGRLPTDPLDTMEAENDVFHGSGSETLAYRWGDYSSMAVDPGDDCTFWYTTEYLAQSGLSWNTRIVSFNFPDCPTFSLSSSAPSQSTNAGSSATYSVSVSAYGAFSGPVNFSPSTVYGLPKGATASFSSGVVSGSGSTSLSVATAASLAPGTYPFDVVGTSENGNAVKSVALALVVTAATNPSIAVSAQPSSQTITQGQPTSYTVTVTPGGGFTGSVTLAVTGCPANATCSFVTSPVNITNSNAVTSTLNVTTGSTTATGTATLTISGTAGALNSQTQVSLTVNPVSSGNFSIGAAPSSQTVSKGGRASYTVTLQSLNGFSGSVNLSVQGLPSHASAKFNSNSLGLSSGGTAQTTLTITTNKRSPSGTYTLTITGDSGSLSNATTVTLIVH